MNKQIDLAWLAGFFDGEGCITLTRHVEERGYPRYCGTVSLTQYNKVCIEKVLTLVEHYGLPTPSILEPRRSSKGWWLCWAGNKGSEFLLALRPYLRHPKRVARAEIYCRFYDPAKKGRHRQTERKELFVEWLRLRIAEAEEHKALEAKWE